MDEYVDKVAVPQVKELLTNYGEFPAILWWDTPGREPNPNINQAQAERLYNAAHSLRPNMIQNDRLGGSFEGDTVTPEQRIPPEGYPGKDWETCMTINGTWGFKKDDENWKSTETLIRNLCDIASKGGNYLLNVGPTAEGVIPEPSVDRLKDVGDWMKVNGEAVYGSKGSPFHQVHGTYDAAKLDRHGQPTFTPTWDWRCTSKPGQLYLMIFDWPSDGVFKLDGLQSKAIRASILGSDAVVDLSQNEQGLTLRLPKVAADPIATVVRVEIADDVARVAALSTK
jgi:alpha-L-fucosidase